MLRYAYLLVSIVFVILTFTWTPNHPNDRVVKYVIYQLADDMSVLRTFDVIGGSANSCSITLNDGEQFGCVWSIKAIDDEGFESEFGNFVEIKPKVLLRVR